MQERGLSMSTDVIITALICVTVIIVSYIKR